MRWFLVILCLLSFSQTASAKNVYFSAGMSAADQVIYYSVGMSAADRVIYF